MVASTANTPFPLGAYLNAPDGSTPANQAQYQTNYNSFSALTGVAPAFLNYYTDYNQPVSGWVSAASWQAWSAARFASSSAATPVLALPMYSVVAGAGTPDQQYLATIAGQNDSMLSGIVKAWVDQGFKNLVIRPGWEMNIPGSTYVGNSVQDEADWVAAFQHIYTVLHQAAAAAGATVTVVWNPNTTNYSNAGATTNLYPGDNYVDAIGADIYSDIYPFSDTTTGAPLYHDWATGAEDTSVSQFIANSINQAHYWTYPAATEWANDSSGGHSQSLTSLIQFAEHHNKPFAIPETGAGNSNSATDINDDSAFPKWLAQQLTAAQAAGEKISFVNLWNSNAGGNYEFSNASDGKPQEAAAWAKYFGVQAASGSSGSTPTPATITLGGGPDVISLAVAEDAWQGDAQITISVNGIQIGGTQTITASRAAGQSQIINLDGTWGAAKQTVTVNFLNDAYGGSASADRNAYVDSISYNGQAIANGSAALLSSGPVNFTFGAPTSITLGSGADTIDLKISEDAWQGNAMFTVSVDGTQVGGTQTATESHAAGQDQDFLVEGNWGTGRHAVTVNFLNDAYGGSGMDRNLYVDGASYDSVMAAGATLALLSGGPQSLTVGTPLVSLARLGSGSDTIDLKMSEDAYKGDGQFTVTIDGQQIGDTQTVQASHNTGQDQDILVDGTWSAGRHTVAIDFLNDLYGGSAAADRNIYLDSATFDGTSLSGATLALLSGGTQSFQANVPDILKLVVAEDAWQGDAQFTVSVDGKPVGGTQTTTASHAAGQSQMFTYAGNWGEGPHTISVDYLNDAYGGSPTTDRNLYVNAMVYDGSSFTENAALQNAGTQSFNVVTSNTYALDATGGNVTTLGADTVNVGSGAVTVNADGPSVNVVGGTGALTFIAHGGNDVVTAGSGTSTITGSTGSLTFTLASGTATATLGTGKATFDLVSGKAGGSLTINDFVTGLDVLHLQGYQGSGIATEQVSDGSTQIMLTDKTGITLTGVTNPYTQSVFG